jgi:hypothetical protein
MSWLEEQNKGRQIGWELLGGNRLLPIILQRLRIAQIVCDFLFQLSRGHHCIQRRLGIGALFRPDPMTP